jgi:hypothetical protein
MAASNAQPFEVNDFSKGITDDVYDQMPGSCEELENFLIGSDRRPRTRYGSELDNVLYPEIPTGVRVGALINYANSDALIYHSLRKMFVRVDGEFVEIVGPDGNPVLSIGEEKDAPALAQWNRHIYATNDAFPTPTKLFKDGNGDFQARNAGLPALASDPVLSSTEVGETSYVYAFYYSDNYTVFDLDYESLGPTKLVKISDVKAPNESPISISDIPVLTNGVDGNLNTANIKVNIYRTENAGTFFRKVGEVTNGVTTFEDSTADVTLADTGIPLYTNDGTVDYDPPPLHKFNHVVNNTGYFAYIKDDNGVSPYRVRQSVPGIPDTAPIDFYCEVDDEIAGISSVRSNPIVFCRKYIYRIDQFFDQFGRGNMVPIRISDTAGCISHNSIVPCENGVFWWGNDGIYYTDGYQVNKVTDQLNDRYKDILKNTTQKNRITGKVFEKERLVIWAIQTNSSNLDNDKFLILDLKFGVSNSMTAVTWSGESFRPTALEIFNDEIYRGDTRGFIFRHKDNLSTDVKVNIYKAPADWVSETIIWRLRSIHYNFGGTFFRKIPSRVLLTAANAGNTTVQITAVNDDGRSIRPCKPIRIRDNFVWGDDEFVWRVSTFIWRGAGIIEQWRRFPAKSLRLSTLQLVITNGFSEITNSDTLGLGTFDTIDNKVTLSAPATWPLECEDYFIATEVDGYIKEYVINERISDTEISVLDPLNDFPAGSLKWELRGYKKGEQLLLLGFNIHWANVSATQEAFDSSAGATGKNA